MPLDDAILAYNQACPSNHAEVRVDGWGAVIAPSGSFDLFSSNALTNMLVSALDFIKPGSSFVIDLSRVSYLPSTAIGALSAAMVKARQNGVSFSVVKVPDPIAKIIKLLGFWEYFNVDGARP